MTGTAMQARQSETFVHASDARVENLELGINRLWFDTGVAGTVHQHLHSQRTCIETGALLDVFNPVREDFLEEGEL